MASPAADPVAQVQPQQQPQQQSHVDIGANVNGLATDEATPSDSGGPTAKRKREATDEGSERSENNHDAKPIINGDHPVRDEKTLIRNYFTVLKSYDTTPSVLKRPLPEPSADDEPQSKRQKSDDEAATTALCIEDKVNQDAYQLLDQLVLDLNKVIKQQTNDLRTSESTDGDRFDEKALVELNRLKKKAIDMHNREMSYPQAAPTASIKEPEFDELDLLSGDANTVLTIYGQAPSGRPLFSSLPKRKLLEEEDSKAIAKPLSDAQLPEGVDRTSILPSTTIQPSGRVPTLGELFPSPANLPPLEAPKSSRTTTKSKVLGFYHPELTERGPYRYDRDSYFHKEMSTGIWLDYSNATPPDKTKDRQRDRVLSLSGQKSPSEDAEVSEMDALFRGAFSSFAPEKDDSGAVVSSGEVGRVWYQRMGYRYVQQLYESELPIEEEQEAVPGITAAEEEEIAKAIEEWDDSLVDPMLADEKDGKKSGQDKDVEETLEEISDLIETLSSYQRNRLLTLPNGQNRSATDPAKVDMLNGSLAEPSDEERATYEMLRDQLAVIIASLPPFAVARLNSDKLEELNVSTKIEVRSQVYKGVMEEDETSARLRQQQAQAAQAASQTPRQAHRTPSFHGNTPAAAAAAYQPAQQQQPYARQYQVTTQTPVPVPNHYQQSPVRQQVPPNFQRQVSAPMTGLQSQQHRPAGGVQPFARPSGWNQQPMQPLRNYGGTGGIPPYAGTPGQGRAASSYQPQHAAAAAAAQAGTPGRYPQGYPGGYTPQQQQHQAGMQPQQYQQPGGIPTHMNGAGSMPPRTMSPQVTQFSTAQSYPPQRSGPGPVPVPVPQPSPRAQVYSPMVQTPGHPAGIPRFPSNGVHPNAAQPSPAAPWGGMTPEQRYQYQTQQRMQALGKANSFNEKMQQNHHAVAGNHHGVAGLGGIGLGGPPVDYQKLAHVRANMAGGVGQSSPSPRLPGAPAVPGPMNGMPQQQQQHMPSPSPVPVPVPGGAATPSPAPSSAGMGGAKPPTPVQ